MKLKTFVTALTTIAIFVGQNAAFAEMQSQLSSTKQAMHSGPISNDISTPTGEQPKNSPRSLTPLSNNQFVSVKNFISDPTLLDQLIAEEVLPNDFTEEEEFFFHSSPSCCGSSSSCGTTSCCGAVENSCNSCESYEDECCCEEDYGGGYGTGIGGINGTGGVGVYTTGIGGTGPGGTSSIDDDDDDEIVDIDIDIPVPTIGRGTDDMGMEVPEPSTYFILGFALLISVYLQRRLKARRENIKNQFKK